MDAASLEDWLARVTADPALRPELIAALADAPVAVALDKGLEDGQLAPDFKPLILNANEGFPVIATFTTPDKVKPWLQQQPAFSNVLVTSFAWVLRIARPPFGIALNPGYRHSLALSPADVDALVKASPPPR